MGTNGKTNRKQMVGRGVHFLWRGSFTRRIISVQSSCNLSRKKNKHTVNETRRRAKNKTLTAYLHFPKQRSKQQGTENLGRWFETITGQKLKTLRLSHGTTNHYFSI